MTIYNLIKDYKLPLSILRRYGYVSSTIARDLKMYEEYLKAGGRNKANLNDLADSYKINKRSVQRIIKKLSQRA